MLQCEVRIWRFGRGRLRPVLNCEAVAAPPVEVDLEGTITPLDRTRLIRPVDELDGYWLEVAEPRLDRDQTLSRLGPILSNLLKRERETLRLAKALASRYEEIELIYTISEMLGRTIRLEETAQRIVEAVAEVVGARRASILVYDVAADQLRPVAGVGKDIGQFLPIPIGDERSVAAQVFRERRTISYDPRDRDAENPSRGEGRGYRGTAFLSIPITYPALDGTARPVGVINLTDRMGTDAFSGGERRLVAAIASQIAVAIENARLVEHDLQRERLQQELALAHDLQLKLLPSPAVLGAHVDAAARCLPAESVGGDFYNFLRLPEGRVGVMLGDVSSHGFSAALIMALVLSAAGIHAAGAATPGEALRSLLDSIATELADTEMHLALFYGVVDAQAGVLRYANAGHPHAFRVGRDGTVERLGATCPPLGLGDAAAIGTDDTRWASGADLLVLFSDGIIDATDDAGTRFGEERALQAVTGQLDAATAGIVKAVFDAAAEFAGAPADDRTVLVLRA